MGYTTDFSGTIEVKFNDAEKCDFVYRTINELNQTRRVKRNVDSERYGIEGEFYFGQEDNIVDYNIPPLTQPSLYLGWQAITTSDPTMLEIQWDGNEKFYEYIAWMKYLIEKLIKPNGGTANGDIKWWGEDSDDMGMIKVENNCITIYEAVITMKEIESV
jgi:hypothetical protein